jgi:pyruvate/2-oxoglutarate dehydrogenase complex dihydrolipoamide dehydrogenase (E3) component
VERRYLGGSCPDINCLPSKNEIWSAKVAYLVRHAAQFGTMTGPGAIDMATLRQRKRKMVDAEIAAHLQNYETSRTELIMGSGRFVTPRTLEVRPNGGGTRVLAGDQVFLNVGTHATIQSAPGLETARPQTNIEALELDYVPPHLIVLGGGYVGLELGQAYRRFGSRVTVIERGPQLMSRKDPDVSDEVERILSDEGIQFSVGAEILHVYGRSGEEVSLVLRSSAVSPRHSRASDDGGGPRLAVRECAASGCPTGHTKTGIEGLMHVFDPSKDTSAHPSYFLRRPGLMVRSRTDACARYSRGRRVGPSGQRVLGLARISLLSPRRAR